jgi:hypothetical protein
MINNQYSIFNECKNIQYINTLNHCYIDCLLILEHCSLNINSKGELG